MGQISLSFAQTRKWSSNEAYLAQECQGWDFRMGWAEKLLPELRKAAQASILWSEQTYSENIRRREREIIARLHREEVEILRVFNEKRGFPMTRVRWLTAGDVVHWNGRWKRVVTNLMGENDCVEVRFRDDTLVSLGREESFLTMISIDPDKCKSHKMTHEPLSWDSLEESSETGGYWFSYAKSG